MEIAAHLDKITRLDDLIDRLDPLEDFELRVWASMTAATNALNACLHHLGLSVPGPYFPHQIPGLYVKPGPDGRWETVFAAPGDVIHIGLPPLPGRIPTSIEEGVRMLDAIEQCREPYVRGGQPVTAELGDACANAYRRCMAIFDAILAAPRPADGGDA